MASYPETIIFCCVCLAETYGKRGRGGGGRGGKCFLAAEVDRLYSKGTLFLLVS